MSNPAFHVLRIQQTEWNMKRKVRHHRVIYIYHHHHIALVARISLTLSRHSSLSFIALGRSLGQHPVSSHSCWMYVRAGRPAFARPCVGIHKSTSLMSSSLLLQQCPACLVRLTWIVFVIGGRWPYSWCTRWCLTLRFMFYAFSRQSETWNARLDTTVYWLLRLKLFLFWRVGVFLLCVLSFLLRLESGKPMVNSLVKFVVVVVVVVVVVFFLSFFKLKYASPYTSHIFLNNKNLMTGPMFKPGIILK